jgi:carbon storage regulator
MPGRDSPGQKRVKLRLVHRVGKKIPPGKVSSLKLSRRVGESVLIGDDVRVTVSRIVGQQGSRRAILLIEAPKDIPVDRTEIHERKFTTKERQ